MDAFSSITQHFCKVCGFDFIAQYKDRKNKKKKALRSEISEPSTATCSTSSNGSTNSKNVTYCATCYQPCVDKPSNTREESIQCSRCNFWYHYQCGNVTGKEHFVTSSNAEWFCQSCEPHISKKSKR